MSNLFENKKSIAIINTAMLVILGGSLVANQVYASKTKEQLGMHSKSAFASWLKKLGGNVKLSGNLGEDAIKIAFIQGMPDMYGQELNVNFDDVQRSMDLMKAFDPTYGNNKITLTGDDLKRYIAVASKIACEYCCGATSLIDGKGEAACGCAHSQAMRGLAAYLIKNHPAHYTDDQILRELARWKGRYFPKQMIKKVSDQITSGNYSPDIASLLLDLKMPKYSGASKEAPLPSEIKDAPGMVGGC